MLNYFKKYDELQAFMKQCVNQVCDGIIIVIVFLSENGIKYHVNFCSLQYYALYCSMKWMVIVVSF